MFRGPLAKYCPEMQHLFELLDKEHIKYRAKVYDYGSNGSGTPMTMERCRFKLGKHKCSVVHGFGTYGGIDILTGKDDGLLEMWGVDSVDDPIGHLTAEKVIENIPEFGRLFRFRED